MIEVMRFSIGNEGSNVFIKFAMRHIILSTVFTRTWYFKN